MSANLANVEVVATRPADSELVGKARTGDRNAYRILVEKYQARVYSLVYDIVRSKEDCEDVVQEAFVKGYLSLGSFKGNSSFYTWLYRIAYNMAIDLKRRSKRRSSDSSVEYDDAALGEQAAAQQLQKIARPDQALDRKRDLDKLNKALKDLSDEHRAVIMLREVDGLSYEEISEVLGVNKGTVMSRLFYARKKIQQVFLEEDIDGADVRAGLGLEKVVSQGKGI